MPSPRTIGFLLIDGFALLSYASIVEPFRAANMLSGVELYRWVHVSVDGRAVRASTGTSIPADAEVGTTLEMEALFVVAGGDLTQFKDRRALTWIRQLARSKTPLAGIAGGPVILAQAGVLDGYRCTVHWGYMPAFAARFPTLMLEQSIYVIDRGRLTCAGGTAGLDLATELIERDHGHSFALRVSDWFISTQQRPARVKQRISLRDRYGVRNDALLKALARMEATVDRPDDRDALARRAGVSLRQLERLFKLHLGSTVGASYMSIRLEHADMLLRNTNEPILAVAISCGFTSSSHFSRRFKEKFGRAPSLRIRR